MNTRASFCAAAVFVSLASAPLALAQTDTGHAYRLLPTSTYQYGCWAPCACPITDFMPVRGSFFLQPTHNDPLFSNYAVQNIRWSIGGGLSQSVIGSGTYRVGGEFAVQQQMTADLSIAGALPMHWDSGLVLGGGYFPRIDITITMNHFYCFDRVFVVHAIPISADWSGGGGGLVNTQSIFDFLRDWFAGDADFDANGVTDTHDIFAFLAAWFQAT